VAPVQTAPHSIRLAGRRGFTLLEILVVIGIILILVAIGVITFGALDQSPKVTKTTLANLQSMLADFDARTRLRDQPQRIWVGNSLTNTNPAVDPPIDLWKTQVVLSNPSSVASGSPTRYTMDGVANTQIVLQFLSRMPENKQLMTKLPSKQIHGLAENNRGSKLTGPTGDTKVIDPPLVLDAWNNPVLFVGSDGLSGVRFESQKTGAGSPTRRVTSTGIVADSPAVTAANRSKSWRPFFASAGPDGDFSTGDDNLYSFEQ
jgi:prepilin-type N-terminal cleavage/methylation domain-containing protein